MKKTNLIKKSAVSLLTLSLIAGMANESRAQAQPLPDGAVAVPVQGGVAIAAVPGMGMPSKEKLGGAKQYQLQCMFALEIHRIDAAAKLEEAQKTKLTIGAKGLAKKKAQEWANSMFAMMGGNPANGPLAAKPKDNEPEIKAAEIKSFADIDAETRAYLGEMLLQEKLYEDADWLKMVKSVLKPEQFTKAEQTITAYKANAEKAMVDAGVAELSLELALSQDQASKLSAIILEHFAKPKPAQVNNGPMVDMSFAMPEGFKFNMELGKLDSKLISQILDPQQFELLELKLASYRVMGAQMAGEAGFDATGAVPAEAINAEGK